MKLTHIISAAAVAMGVAAGGAAFQLASSPAPTPVQPVSDTSQRTSEDAEPPTVVGGVQFQWAPCKAPAVLEGDECVTHETRTVTLPPASSSGGRSSGGYSGGSTGSDHSGGQGYDDDSDDQGYDDESDDDGSESHGDDHEDHEDHGDEPDEPEHD